MSIRRMYRRSQRVICPKSDRSTLFLCRDHVVMITVGKPFLSLRQGFHAAESLRKRKETKGKRMFRMKHMMLLGLLLLMLSTMVVFTTGVASAQTTSPARAAVSCYNTSCDGHDPVSSGCDSDAQTKYTATSNDLGGGLRATISLRYSVACLAAWGKVTFNQSMPSGHYGDAYIARNSDNKQYDCIMAGGNGKVWPGQTSCYSGMVGDGFSLTAYAAGFYWSPYAWKQVATTASY